MSRAFTLQNIKQGGHLVLIVQVHSRSFLRAVCNSSSHPEHRSVFNGEERETHPLFPSGYCVTRRVPGSPAHLQEVLPPGARSLVALLRKSPAVSKLVEACHSQCPYMDKNSFSINIGQDFLSVTGTTSTT